MDAIVSLLKENPLLLLFLVAGIGFPLGRVKIGGASLGVAAVLFVGLGFGAFHPEIKLPEVIYQLGLVLFVYTIGLSSGSVFFASLRSKGLGYNLLVAGGLIFAALIAMLAAGMLNIKSTLAAGMYTGSLTNTPALAAVVEYVKSAVPSALVDQAATEPVVAYSLTYPIGVLGMILTVYILQRVWKIDYQADAKRASDLNVGAEPLISQTILIGDVPPVSVSHWMKRKKWNVIFGRIRTVDETQLVTGNSILTPGALVSIIGPEEDIQLVVRSLGAPSDERLDFDISKYDKRRIFISNQQITGRPLRDLDLFNRFGAVVTRLRRGDLELLPHGDTLLQPGDQVRVVAPHEQMDAISSFLGDSYRAVSEVDVLTFGLGLALGLLVGLIPIPIPGGITLRLGIAGGPLVMALILGAFGRTGPMVWSLPYSANLTLRQVGLVFFLAGVGTRSGYAFVTTLSQGSGLVILLAGAVITCLTALLVLWVGYKLMKIPMGLLIGILAGLETQPALLGFALEQSQNELPNIGYTTVYPVSMVLKIILAQLILVFLMR